MTQALMTTEEYYARPDGDCIEELLEGELLMSPCASSRHRAIIERLVDALRALGRQYVAVSEGGVYLAKTPNPMDGRPSEVVPDVMVLRRADWEAATRRGTKQRLPYRPLLAIEVLSPGNTEAEIMRKAHSYLREGAYECWIVDDDQQSVRVIYSNRTAEEVQDEIATPHPLPHIDISLTEIFQ
jgi:Uma2 family endonuclease